MICVEIDAYFTRRGRNQKSRLLRGSPGATKETVFVQPIREGSSLKHTPPTNQEFGNRFASVSCEPFVDFALHPHSILSAVTIDEHTGWPLAETPCPLSKLRYQLRRIIEHLNSKPLGCFKTLRDGLVSPLFGRKPKDLLSASAIFAPRCRQRKQPERRHDLPVLLLVRAKSVRSVCNPLEKFFKRRNQMRLVEHEERVGTEQPCVIGPHLARYAVTREEKPRADHINSADDDGGSSRIHKPFPIVHMLAA